MNKTLLLLAVSTLLFGCTKYGCTDELSTNYDAEVEKEDNASCNYGSDDYSIWFNKETSDSLATKTDGNLHIFAIDTNEIFNDTSHIAAFKHVGNMDPGTFSTSAPSCDESVFINDTLRNMTITKRRTSGSVLNILITTDLSNTDGNAVLWSTSVSTTSTTGCQSIEITL